MRTKQGHLQKWYLWSLLKDQYAPPLSWWAQGAPLDFRYLTPYGAKGLWWQNCEITCFLCVDLLGHNGKQKRRRYVGHLFWMANIIFNSKFKIQILCILGGGLSETGLLLQYLGVVRIATHNLNIGGLAGPCKHSTHSGHSMIKPVANSAAWTFG